MFSLTILAAAFAVTSAGLPEIKAINKKATFANAQAHCKSMGGSLVKIADQATNSRALQACRSLGSAPCWIGLEDTSSEGQFKWIVDGTVARFTNWGQGEPNNWANNEDCAFIRSDGKWNDIACNRGYPYLCQVNVAPKPAPAPPARPAPAPPAGPATKKLTGKLIKVTAKKNARGAFADCKKRGGQLAIIADAATNEIARKACGVDRCWIGLHDSAKEGEFKWIDGSIAKYTNWAPNQPDNWGSGEDCVEIFGFSSVAGKWNDNNCGRALPYLCEIPLNTESASVSQAVPKDIQLVTKRLGWMDAEKYCDNKGGRLLVIKNAATNKKAADICKGGPCWVGLNDAENEGDFKWLDGTKVSYNNWFPGEPNNWGSKGEDCVFVINSPRLKRFGWNDAPCGWTLPFLCEMGITKPKPMEIVRTDSYLTYAQARDTCKKKGGDLLVIKDKATNDKAMAACKGQRCWIGLDDAKQEGKFMWVDGKPLGYKNWLPRQPDNWRNYEDCVEVVNWPGRLVGWNDRHCLARSKSLCNIPIKKEAKIIKVSTRRTFKDAQNDCKSKGGNLLEIPDLITNKKAKEICGRDACWIGAQDEGTEGTFVWPDGDKVKYADWARNQPDNWRGAGANGEDCVMITPHGWNDGGCHWRYPYLCEINGVAAKNINENELDLNTNKYEFNEKTNEFNKNNNGIFNDIGIKTFVYGSVFGVSLVIMVVCAAVFILKCMNPTKKISSKGVYSGIKQSDSEIEISASDA